MKKMLFVMNPYAGMRKANRYLADIISIFNRGGYGVTVHITEDQGDAELADILDFHAQFEKAVPFDDGNGRIGRLIMFKECLRHGTMPFIIDDKRRSRYLRGIKEWHDDRFEMIDVVMEAQDRFEAQIELQRLHAAGQFFAPVSYQEGFDDEDE